LVTENSYSALDGEKANFVKMSREPQSQTKFRLLEPKEYKTNVFNKNTKVDGLISITQPTVQQALKRKLLLQAQEQLEKAKIERKRRERNLRMKVALTQK